MLFLRTLYGGIQSCQEVNGAESEEAAFSQSGDGGRLCRKEQEKDAKEREKREDTLTDQGLKEIDTRDGWTGPRLLEYRIVSLPEV